MTRERAKELIPVITAFSNGQSLQWNLSNDLSSGWRDLDYNLNPDFDHSSRAWRIKPSPREWWICFGRCFDSYDVAAEYANSVSQRVSDIAHVREVI